MKRDEQNGESRGGGRDNRSTPSKADHLLKSKIGDSIDILVEYLADHDVDGIHTLIMGEVEKRLIIRALERSRGNKLQAAKMLGMSRNTFHRKLQKLTEDIPPAKKPTES